MSRKFAIALSLSFLLHVVLAAVLLMGNFDHKPKVPPKVAQVQTIQATIVDKSKIEALVNKIKKSGSDILLMSSPPADSLYLFERHDKTLFKESPNEKLIRTRHIVSKIASDNQLYFLDIYQAFSDLNVPKHNTDLFFRNVRNSNARDGVHPTVLGYRFIAQNVYQYLKDNELLETNTKIICLGDSITRGGKEGSNYPAYLHGLIKN